MVAEEIKADPEHAQHFQRVAQTLPDDFVDKVASDAMLLKHFSDHVKSGLAEKVIPEAVKSQMLYGGDFFSHYSRIGETMLAEDNKPQETTKPVITDRERELRNKASSPSRGKPKVSFKADADSIWDMDDEAFNNLTSADLK